MLNVKHETDDLERVIRKALKAEKSLEERKHYAGDYYECDRRPGPREPKDPKDPKDRKPKREWTRFKNRNGGACHFKPGESEGSKEATEKIRANAASPMDSPKEKPKAGPSNYHNKKLSRNKKDTLRAEGRCFNCQEPGHEQRNCPKLNSMKPPRTAVNTGSIRLTNLDRLAREKDRADAFVGSMSLIGYDNVEDRKSVV